MELIVDCLVAFFGLGNWFVSVFGWLVGCSGALFSSLVDWPVGCLFFVLVVVLWIGV